jgi:hypothetical protein
MLLGWKWLQEEFIKVKDIICNIIFCQYFAYNLSTELIVDALKMYGFG